MNFFKAYWAGDFMSLTRAAKPLVPEGATITSVYLLLDDTLAITYVLDDVVYYSEDGQ